ncbi:hypothetical protein A7982_13207 [Minicystis rosea]|nr:hypothetical protein A7982_13207 [Minicystis rosea]
MDFEPDFKWQHFAFAADASLLEALSRAVTTLFETGDPNDVFAFYDAHDEAFEQRKASVRIVVPSEDARLALERAGDGVAAGGGDRTAFDRACARIAATSGPVSLVRLSWERLRDAAERLSGGIAAGFPRTVIAHHIQTLMDVVRHLFDWEHVPRRPESSAPSTWYEDRPFECATACLTFCLSPFPENVGIRGGYELCEPMGGMLDRNADPFSCAELMPPGRIPSPDVAVWYSVLEEQPHGVLLAPGDAGPVAIARGEELRAFAEAIRLPQAVIDDPRTHADDGTSLDFVVSDDEDDDWTVNQPVLRRRVERYAAACREIHARGQALVTWVAKNPAL